MKVKHPRPIGQQQRPRRDCERDLRWAAVAFARWASRAGVPEAATRLGLRPRTLQRWRRQWRCDRLHAPDRGRPLHVADGITRQAVVEVLEDLGPSVGVPALKTMFPAVIRTQLSDVCHDYRKGLAAAAAEGACHLAWHGPGRVWAMDFTEPPLPVDGLFPYVLLVRDLASGRQLLAQPAAAPTSAVAVAALRELFLTHGPPLVIKADNGSSFIAGDFLDLLVRFEVKILFSPPVVPQYNGAIEAGNGSLKSHARAEALRHGHVSWTSDDLEAACTTTNYFAHPWGDPGPTPEDRWQARSPITPAERRAFLSCLERHTADVLTERKIPSHKLASRAVRSAVDRAAIRRALEERDYLFVWRGRHRPLLKSKKRHFIR